MGVAPVAHPRSSIQTWPLRLLAEAQRIHLYHYNISEPRRHGHRPSTDTIQNKTMMPLPK